jgi:two-component system sensor histidine kinase YesM
MVSLKKHFSIMFLLIVALPMLALCPMLSWLYMNALLQTVSSDTRNLMAEISQSIEDELSSVSKLTATLIYEKELVKDAIALAESAEGKERIAANWKLGGRLSDIFSISNRIGAIAIYMRDGSIVPVSNYPNIRSFALAERSAFLKAKENREKVVVADNLSGVTENGGGQFILSAFVSPSAENGGSAIDAILVMFRVPYLDRFISNSFRDDGPSLSIIGRNRGLLLSGLSDKLVLSDLRQLSESAFDRPEIRMGGKSYLVCTGKVDLAGWTLVLTTDKASVTKRIMVYQWYIYPAIALMLGLFMAYSLTFFSNVAAPLEAVIENMRRFGGGISLQPIDRIGIKELEALRSNFDGMVEDIKRLDAEREVQNAHRLAAEIKALQFQINPHFIANTLNSIRMVAIASRNDAIRDMAQSLMRILKRSYLNSGSLASLSEEIENIESYIAIMKFRFGGYFAMEYELSEDSLDRKLLKMCLQPIVENAILHGLSESSRQGTLKIRSRVLSDGDLEIEVEDDGVGMDAATVESLLGTPGSEESQIAGPGDEGMNRIGLRNVRDRLTLNFGARYSLGIKSAPGRGTTVRLTFPA